MRREWNASLRDAFIQHLKETGNVAEATRRIGVSRTQVYRMRERDWEFGEAWELANEVADEAVECEARRRALEAIEEPMLRHGQPVLAADGTPMTVRRYDDRMLAFVVTRKIRRDEAIRRRLDQLRAKERRAEARAEARQ